MNNRKISLTIIIIFFFCITVNSSYQVDFLIDASGSMWGRVDGRPKIEVAKEVFGQIIDDLSDRSDIRVSVRVYGGERKSDCKDSKVVYPMGRVEADLLKSKIRKISPKGKTPITYSLFEAENDFLEIFGGEKVIILLTDGLETCGGDPCDAADTLNGNGIVTKLHVVGFDLSGEELERLQCLTAPSGGLLLNARDASTLRNAFRKLLNIESKMNNVQFEFKDLKGDPVNIRVEVYNNGDLILKEEQDYVYIDLPSGTYDFVLKNPVTDEVKEYRDVDITRDHGFSRTEEFRQTSVIVNGYIRDEKINIICEVHGDANSTVKTGDGRDVRFDLAPGVYDIVVQYPYISKNNTKTLSDVRLSGTEIKKIDVSFPFSSITVNNTDEYGDPVNAECSLVEVSTGRVVNDYRDSRCIFDILPGYYDLKAVYNYSVGKNSSIIKYNRNIKIKENDFRNIENKFDICRLKIKAFDSYNSRTSFRAELIGEDGLVYGEFSGGNQPVAPGVYSLEVTYDDLGRSVRKSFDIELKDGEDKVMVIKAGIGN